MRLSRQDWSQGIGSSKVRGRLVSKTASLSLNFGGCRAQAIYARAAEVQQEPIGLELGPGPGGLAPAGGRPAERPVGAPTGKLAAARREIPAWCLPGADDIPWKEPDGTLLQQAPGIPGQVQAGPHAGVGAIHGWARAARVPEKQREGTGPPYQEMAEWLW